MVAGAVAAQVEVVLVLVGVHAEFGDAALEDVEALLALGAADDLADAGNEAVGRGDGLAVVIEAHVEGLDGGRVVGDEGRLAEVLLGQVALVLGLEVDAPLDGVLELGAGGLGVLQDLDGVGVGDAREVGAGDVLEALEQALVDELVEHLELVGAAVHDVANDVLEHVLGHVHLALEVAEGHLGLDHPELGGVATGVGVLGTEGRAEGVDVTEAHGEVLALELAGDGEVGGLAEEVLAVVDRAILVQGRVGGVDRGDAEHLAGALGVGGGDDGSVHVDVAALLEERVDREGRDRADAEDGAEEVGAAAQVLVQAQVLAGLALLLHGVVGLGRPLDEDRLGLQLEGRRAVGGELEGALDLQRGTDGEGRDLGVIGKLLAIHDDLQVLEAAAVIQHDEAKVLHVANRANPAGDGHLSAAELVHLSKETSDRSAVHLSSSLLADGHGMGPCHGKQLS